LVELSHTGDVMDDSFTLLCASLRSSLSDTLELVPKNVPTSLDGLTGRMVASLLDQVFAFGFPHLIPDGYVWSAYIGTSARIRLSAGTDQNSHLLFVGPPYKPYNVIDLLQGNIIWHSALDLEDVLKAQAETDLTMDGRGYMKNNRRIGLLEAARPVPNALVFHNDWRSCSYPDLATAKNMQMSFEKPGDLICIPANSKVVLCRVQDANEIGSVHKNSTFDRVDPKAVARAVRRLTVQRDPRRYS